MKGTEKQIKWATEIIETIRTILDNTIDGMKPVLATATEDQKKNVEQNIAFLRDRIDRMEAEDAYAGDIIDLFRDVKLTGNTDVDFKAWNAVYNVCIPNTDGQRVLLGR